MPYPFFVLTGGPCSGKTTIIRALKDRGYFVIEEAAMRVIRSDPDGTLRAQPLEFQRRILDLQLEDERRALGSAVLGNPNGDSRVFVDRGIGDHFAYLALDGIEPFPELLKAWDEAVTRYQAVFLLDGNPNYEATIERTETPEEARRAHESIKREYQSRHPRVERVKWDSVDARIEFILRLSAPR
ncbi:MAG: ATP-binding protein [Planctomycetota bacterium]